MKKVAMGIAAASFASLLVTGPADARRHHYRHHKPIVTDKVSIHVADANGNAACRNGTVSRKTAYGKTICVDPVFADKFLTLISNLKVAGCEIKEIVCQAYGHMRGSNHLGGGACDFDQKSRNVTTASCMYRAGGLIQAAGLYDGCGIHDCGHVEAMRGLGHYGFERRYASRHSSHQIYAARSHHHKQYAYDYGYQSPQRLRYNINFVAPDRMAAAQ